MPLTPIPTEPAHLTAEWLTDALRSSSATTARVVAHTWELVPQQGAAGVVGRAVLTYDGDDPNAPRTVVIKFATPHAPIRTIMNRFGFYRSEVEFYRQLGADAGIPIPRCYFADIDISTGFFVLVLEDMADSRASDPMRPAVADVEMAIDHLAPFHAKWWKSPRLREIDWLPYPEGPAFDARVVGLQQSFAASVTAVRQKLGAAFPAVLSIACDHILSDWFGFVRSRLVAPLTLSHRDFHSQQIFYPSPRGGRFAVFDWQTLTIGPGADDLARIVSMGLTTADRATHDRDLIRRYYEALVANGVEDYSLEQCTHEFRLGLTASLTTNVVAVATIDLSVVARMEAETGINFIYAVFDRLAAAFEAHDVIAVLPRAH